MDQSLFAAWRSVVPDLGTILKRMQEKTIIGVGSLPYPRIIPALFLDNYQIFCVKDVTDLDVLRQHASISCLEEKSPKIAKKVQATSYLLRNYVFQGFLRSRRYPYRLLLQQTTPPIVKILAEQKIEWIGNDPASFETVLAKGPFREVIKQLGLPHLPDWYLPRDEFLAMSFSDLFNHWGKPVVVQRADIDVSGMQGTFFLHTESDWQQARQVLAADTRYKTVQISPFITGHSVSMLGCITQLGVLTTPLQMQLIDVPEVLSGQPPTGTFLGHDWGARPWSEQTQQRAKKIVESVGAYLGQRGFKGIFGIDFMYDAATQQLFPLECNPRFTGALPVYSLMIMRAGRVPPLEFFHLMTHLGIDEFFDFDVVNHELKQTQPVAHVSLTPYQVYEMKLPLKAGIYTFLPEQHTLRYRRPGAFLTDLKDPNEFILIDSVPRHGQRIVDTVPRIFKLIFNRSIALSSYTVQPEVGYFVTALTSALRQNQTPPAGKGDVPSSEEE